MDCSVPSDTVQSHNKSQFLHSRKAACRQVNTVSQWKETDPASTRHQDFLRWNAPWRCVFLSPGYKGKVWWPPHTEKPGDEQDEYWCPCKEGRDFGDNQQCPCVPSSNTSLVSADAACDFSRKGELDDKQIKSQYSHPVDSNSPVCVDKVLVLKTFMLVEQELFATQRVSTVTLQEICLCLWASYLFWGRNSQLRSNSSIASTSLSHCSSCCQNNPSTPVRSALLFIQHNFLISWLLCV